MVAGAIFMLLMLGTETVLAHVGDKGFATITASGKTVQYAYSLPLTSLHLEVAQAMGMAAVDAGADFGLLAKAIEGKIHVSAGNQRCLAGPAVVTPPADATGGVAVTMQFTCPGDISSTLVILDRLTDLFGSTYVTLATIQWPGGSQPFVFQRDTPEATVSLAHRGSGQSFASFFVLGIEHILVGWDHLLFLLCLLMGGGRPVYLVKVVTAFTVAHSVTLIAAALDWIAIPSRIVESAIALSIVYVTAENILLRERGVSKRWLVALLFGFVHGFGFSSVLKEIGLPSEGVVWALLAFNLGVEAGQVIVVACTIPALWCLQRVAWHARALSAVSGIVLLIGSAVFVQRAFL